MKVRWMSRDEADRHLEWSGRWVDRPFCRSCERTHDGWYACCPHCGEQGPTWSVPTQLVIQTVFIEGERKRHWWEFWKPRTFRFTEKKRKIYWLRRDKDSLGYNLEFVRDEA